MTITCPVLFIAFKLNISLIYSKICKLLLSIYNILRFRVVTLEGQIIEISGTMSGGGTQKLSGLMGQQVIRPFIAIPKSNYVK